MPPTLLISFTDPVRPVVFISTLTCSSPSLVFQMPAWMTPVSTEAPALSKMDKLNVSVCQHMEEGSVRLVRFRLVLLQKLPRVLKNTHKKIQHFSCVKKLDHNRSIQDFFSIFKVKFIQNYSTEIPTNLVQGEKQKHARAE